MRKPDENKTVRWKGHEVEIDVWCDPTEIPWESDEELKPGSEGWDVVVRATLESADGDFVAFGSVCAIWFERGGDKIVRERIEDATKEALGLLESEIKRVASGEDVKKAKSRRDKALLLRSQIALFKEGTA